MRLFFIIVVVFTLFASSASADKYFGIYPFASLYDVKSIYPNAQYTEKKPAWLKEDQKFVSIYGSGIDGVISIIFTDDLRISQNLLTQIHNKKADGIGLLRAEDLLLQSLPKNIEVYRSKPEDAHWIVDEIRWTPPGELKLSKFIKRYGKPNAEEIDENMNRYKIWNKFNDIRAIVDDKDIIDTVFYTFSDYDFYCWSDWSVGKPCNPKDFFTEDRPSTPKKKKTKK